MSAARPANKDNGHFQNIYLKKRQFKCQVRYEDTVLLRLLKIIIWLKCRNREVIWIIPKSSTKYFEIFKAYSVNICQNIAQIKLQIKSNLIKESRIHKLMIIN